MRPFAHFFSPLLCHAGPIPEAVGALTNLVDVNLNNNQLSGKALTFACISAVVRPKNLEHY